MAFFLSQLICIKAHATVDRFAESNCPEFRSWRKAPGIFPPIDALMATHLRRGGGRQRVEILQRAQRPCFDSNQINTGSRSIVALALWLQRRPNAACRWLW